MIKQSKSVLKLHEESDSRDYSRDKSQQKGRRLKEEAMMRFVAVSDFLTSDHYDVGDLSSELIVASPQLTGILSGIAHLNLKRLGMAIIGKSRHFSGYFRLLCYCALRCQPPALLHNPAATAKERQFFMVFLGAHLLDGKNLIVSFQGGTLSIDEQRFAIECPFLKHIAEVLFNKQLKVDVEE